MEHVWDDNEHPNVCARCGLYRQFRRMMQSGQPEFEYFILREGGERQFVQLRWCRRTTREGKRPSQWDRIADPDNLKAFPEHACCQCGKTDNDDGSTVTWRCQVCERRVCRECTLTIPGQGRLIEYYAATLCSEACWVLAGKPSE